MTTTLRFYAANDALGELSNFYLHKPTLKYQDKSFATSEHLYQFLKFAYTGASEASLAFAEEIRKASTAFKAKLLARQTLVSRYPWQRALRSIIAKYKDLGVQPRSDWEEVKREQMLICLRTKFQQDSRCKSTLLSTCNASLIEASTRDSYWGEGGDGKGLNVLGQLLCQVREEIRESNALAQLPSSEFEDDYAPAQTGLASCAVPASRKRKREDDHRVIPNKRM
jgi:N-glycosidase YbiA